MAQIDKITNYRQIYAPDNQRMGFGEHFHIVITEKLRLPFIMNFLKLHITVFMPRKYIKMSEKPPLDRRSYIVLSQS